MKKGMMLMSNSSLVNVRVPAYSGNYTKGRSSKISEITIHHMAGVGSAESCGNIFATPGRCGSSHYGIGNDGRIGLYVDECDTAWTNGNWESNCRAVTIETSNSSTGGNWAVGDKALNSLIKLVADISKRNGLGKLVKGKNLTWHCMYSATACPGAYLLSKMDYIVEQANKINYPETKSSEVSKVVGITGINKKTRNTNDLILIADGRKTTGFNQWGVDVIVDSDGKIISILKYNKNTSIPSGCICISGHGTGASYLISKCKVGNHLQIC